MRKPKLRLDSRKFLKPSKALLSVGLCIGLMSSFSLNSAQAATNSDFQLEACPEVNSYITEYKSHYTYKGTDFTHEATNPSSVADTVSRSVAISHQATVSIGGEVEFKTLAGGAKINANVGYGFNSTKTLTITWSVPKGTWILRAKLVC